MQPTCPFDRFDVAHAAILGARHAQLPKAPRSDNDGSQPRSDRDVSSPDHTWERTEGLIAMP
jgi:hypothetical protein